MSTVAQVLGALFTCILILALFTSWERRGKSHYVVVGLLIVLIVDAVLYSNESLEPRGIFHPGSGSLELRLPEVIISLALLARLVVRGMPTRIGLPALLWGGYAAWMMVAAAEGILRHNNMTDLTYEAKAIVYVTGAYALASGIPVRNYLEGRIFERLANWSAVAAAVLIVMTLAGWEINRDLPLVPLSSFGSLGTDAATIFVSIGLIGLLVALARPRRSMVTVLAAIPLLISAFFADQRAAILGLTSAVGVLVLASIGPRIRARLHLSGTEVVLAALAVVAVVLVVTIAPSVSSQQAAQLPLASRLDTTFNAVGKVESAEDRTNQLSAALPYVRQHPIIGNGLGFEYTWYDVGFAKYATTDLTHNIFLDTLLREGLVGLVLFVLALLVSLWGGLKVVGSHPDRVAGVLCLALVVVIVGLLAKAMFESDLENYRLATLLGVCLGTLRSGVTSFAPSSTPDASWTSTPTDATDELGAGIRSISGTVRHGARSGLRRQFG